MEEGESYTVTIRVQKRQKRSKDPKGENGKDIKRGGRGKSSESRTIRKLLLAEKRKRER